MYAIDGEVAGLTVTRIDPEKEVAIYRGEVLAKAGAGLDAAGRALVEEDLRSPCTEEIAVFRAFARTVDQGEDCFVVLDTAPRSSPNPAPTTRKIADRRRLPLTINPLAAAHPSLPIPTTI